MANERPIRSAELCAIALQSKSNIGHWHRNVGGWMVVGNNNYLANTI